MSKIGHNAPPPHEAFGLAIDDLAAEAENFLDGKPIESGGQADSLGKIIAQMRELRKGADAARAAEKKPHDDAGKAVQAKWKPSIERADVVIETAKRPVTIWLIKLEQEQREEAERQRKQAEAAQQALIAKERAASPDDLAAQMKLAAERRVISALSSSASRAEKAKAQAAGEGRAMGLRTSYEAELTDPMTALKYYRETRPDDLKAWLLEMARREVGFGTRTIPGFVIHERKKAA